MTQMNQSIWNAPQPQQLLLVLSEMSQQDMLQDFLRDVLTEKEIIEISARLEAARLLSEGEKYTTIAEKTRLSSRTIARISQWRKNGTSGYSAAIDIIKNHHTHMLPVRD